MKANVWLTTAIVLGVVLVFLGFLYSFYPEAFFRIDAITSRASQAANSGDNATAVSQLNKCVTQTSKAAISGLRFRFVRNRLAAEAKNCLDQRLAILRANSRLLAQQPNLRLLPNQVVSGGQSLLESDVSNITGTVALNDPRSGQALASNTLLVQLKDNSIDIVNVPASVNSQIALGSTVTFSGISLPSAPGSALARIVTANGLALTVASGNFKSTGPVSVAIQPVFFSGEAPSTQNLQTIAKQLADYYTKQPDSKVTLTVTVLPAVNTTAAPDPSCSPPDTSVAGFDHVIYVLYGGCTVNAGFTTATAAAVSSDQTLYAYVHELGHHMGLFHIAGGNPTGDPMQSPAGSQLGQFNVVNKYVLGWIQVKTAAAGNNVLGSGDQAFAVEAGCPSGSQFYTAGSDLFIDAQGRVYCAYNASAANQNIGSEYKGDLNNGPFTGANVTVTKTSSGISLAFNGSNNLPGGNDGSVTPPPTAPLPTSKGGGNPVTVGKLGNVSLVCPSQPVIVQAGGEGQINLTATGDSRIGMSAEIPNGISGMGPNDQGVRGKVTRGFSRSGDPRFATVVLHPGTYSSLAVEVDASVAPGDYSIDVEGEAGTYVATDDPINNNEPALVSLFTTCKAPIHVIGTPAGLVTGANMHIYQYGKLVDNQTIFQQQVDPNRSASGLKDSDVQQTKLTWAAYGVGSCHLNEGSSDGKFLGSGAINGQDGQGNGVMVGPYASDTAIVLTCDGVAGGSGSAGSASVSTTIRGYSLVRSGLTARIELWTAGIDLGEAWIPQDGQHDAEIAHWNQVGRGQAGAGCTSVTIQAGDSVPGTANPLPSTQQWMHCFAGVLGHSQDIGHGTEITVPSGSTVQVDFDATNAVNCSLDPLGAQGTFGESAIAHVTAPVLLTLTCNDASGKQFTTTAHINVTGAIGSGGAVDAITCNPQRRDTFREGGDYTYTVTGTGKFSSNLQLTAGRWQAVDFTSRTPDGQSYSDNAVDIFVSGYTIQGNKVIVHVDKNLELEDSKHPGNGYIQITPNGDDSAACVVQMSFAGFRKGVGLDGQWDKFHADTKGVTLAVGETKQVNISGAFPPFRLGSLEDPDIAVASINGSVVTIIGVSPGSTTIDVSDSHSNFAQPGDYPNDYDFHLPVTVTSGSANGNNGTGLTSGTGGSTTTTGGSVVTGGSSTTGGNTGSNGSGLGTTGGPAATPQVRFVPPSPSGDLAPVSGNFQISAMATPVVGTIGRMKFFVDDINIGHCPNASIATASPCTATVMTSAWAPGSTHTITAEATDGGAAGSNKGYSTLTVSYNAATVGSGSSSATIIGSGSSSGSGIGSTTGGPSSGGSSGSGTGSSSGSTGGSSNNSGSGLAQQTSVVINGVPQGSVSKNFTVTATVNGPIQYHADKIWVGDTLVAKCQGTSCTLPSAITIPVKSLPSGTYTVDAVVKNGGNTVFTYSSSPFTKP
jgi:hypothetical protein